MSYYQENREAFLEGLKTFLRIPSISTEPEHRPDIQRAAEFVRDELSAAGMAKAELIEGAGHPLVYAEWLGAPGKPTLLFYGHYDVQPVEPAGGVEIAAPSSPRSATTTSTRAAPATTRGRCTSW